MNTNTTHIDILGNNYISHLPLDLINQWSNEIEEVVGCLMTSSSPEPDSNADEIETPEGCCGNLKNCYKKVEVYISALGDSISLLENGAKARLFDDIVRLLKNLSQNTDPSQRSDLMQRSINIIKLAPIVFAPIALYTIMSQGYACATGNEKVDAGLRTLEGFAWLSDSISGFVKGLSVQNGSLVTNQLSVAAYSLSIAGTILWISTAVLNVKRVHANNKVLQNIDQVLVGGKSPHEPIHTDDYVKVIKLFSDKQEEGSLTGYSDYNLKEHFNVEGKELRSLLGNINSTINNYLVTATALETLAGKYSNPSSKDSLGVEKDEKENAEDSTSISGELNKSANALRKEAHKVSENTVNSLEGRIKSNNFSRKLTILSALIYTIGMCVLLFSAFTPVGYAFLAICAAISIYKTIHEYRATNKFKKHLEEISVPAIVHFSGIKNKPSGQPPTVEVMV